jgi:DHA1 family bicyclomycin/chloramphenicol resistance-like MFS transporter
VAYSLLFAVNAIGLIGSAQTNVLLIRRFGAPRLVLLASGVQAASACTLLGLAWLHVDTVPLIAVCLFFCIASQGLLGPPTAMLALEPHPEIAGAASALMGTLQFACGAVSSALVSLFFNGTSVPFAAVLAGCGLAGFGLSAILASGSRVPSTIAVE